MAARSKMQGHVNMHRLARQQAKKEKDKRKREGEGDGRESEMQPTILSH